MKYLVFIFKINLHDSIKGAKEHVRMDRGILGVLWCVSVPEKNGDRISSA